MTSDWLIPPDEDIVLDEETHTYFVDGVIYQGVTDTINRLNLDGYANSENLEYSSNIERAGARGGAVHKATEYIDQGILNRETTDVRVLAYSDGYEEMLTKHKVRWDYTECKVCSKRLRRAGKFDRLGLFDGVMSIVDVKTPQKKKCHAIQGAAYVELAEEYYKIKIDQAVFLYLTKESKCRVDIVSGDRLALAKTMWHYATSLDNYVQNKGD